jgi:dephospho-CoA kinase
MIVGLTGGIGSGKTTIANFFAEFKNVVIYNADLEARNLMNTSPIIKTKMIEEFGQEAYQKNQLNRPFIANLVFKDKSKLAALNAIVHPEVKKHFQEFVIQQKDNDYIVYENAILFESKSNLKCDVIISVFAPLEVRVERTVLRDGSSKTDVENRIKNQWLEDKKLLQSNYVIANLTLENAYLEVVEIHNILTKRR